MIITVLSSAVDVGDSPLMLTVLLLPVVLILFLLPLTTFSKEKLPLFVSSLPLPFWTSWVPLLPL